MRRKKRKAEGVAAAVILMIVAAVCAWLFSVPSGVSKSTVTVGVATGCGVTVSSANPLTVEKGETVSFNVSIGEDYIFKSTPVGALENGVLTFVAERDLTVHLDLAKYCTVTAKAEGHGTARAESDQKILEGNQAAVLLYPEANYTVGGIRIGDMDYPAPVGNRFTFTVADDSEVCVSFVGKPVSFSVMSSAIGSVEISGTDGEYRYGDILHLKSVCGSDDVIFNGWSVNAYLNEGGRLLNADAETDITLTGDITVYANFKDRNTYPVVYEPNGGTFSGTVEKYSPGELINLAVDNGKIKRDGYTLIGYSEKPDGSGRKYALGGRVSVPKGGLTVYACWAKQTDAAYLDCSGGVLKGLTAAGKAAKLTELVVPPTVNGGRVTAVAASAFSGNNDLKTVVLPTGVLTVGDKAFSGCASLTTVYLPETLTVLSNTAFSGCPRFTTMQVIASLGMVFDYDFDAAIADKYVRLTECTGKRMILIGGSSLGFGMNSAELHAAYPDYTVINFSGSAYSGIMPMLDIIRAQVRKDDIVILAPEYYPYTYAYRESTGILTWEFLESDYSILYDINIQNNPVMLAYYTDYLAQKRAFLPNKRLNPGSVYVRSSFNAAGDAVCPRKNIGFIGLELPDSSIITPEGMKRFNELGKYIDSVGARCFFTYAPHSLGSSSRESVRTATAGFTEKLKNGLDSRYVKLISELSDYYFDYRLFFDNCYHMTAEGASERTKQLISDLAKYMEE